MTAGVPGLGLGGLFALFAALGLPLLRSRSRGGAGRLFAMALLIVAAAVLAWQSLAWLYSAVSSGASTGSAGDTLKRGPAAVAQPVMGHLFGMPVIAISLALMTFLLLAGELSFRVLGVRPTPLPPPVPAPTGLVDEPQRVRSVTLEEPQLEAQASG